MNKIISVLSIVLAVGSASASELYWMIEGASDSTYSGGAYQTTVSNTKTGESDFINWTVATLYANSDVVKSISAADFYEEVGYTLTELGSYGSSDYSFYVELKDSAGRMATSASIGYADLVSHLSLGGPGAGSVTPYQFTGFAGAVPEPTTGLLMLFGLAGLALRRRRA